MIFKFRISKLSKMDLKENRLELERSINLNSDGVKLTVKGLNDILKVLKMVRSTDIDATFQNSLKIDSLTEYIPIISGKEHFKWNKLAIKQNIIKDKCLEPECDNVRRVPFSLIITIMEGLFHMKTISQNKNEKILAMSYLKLLELETGINFEANVERCKKKSKSKKEDDTGVGGIAAGAIKFG